MKITEKLNILAQGVLDLFPSEFPIECTQIPLAELVAKPRKKSPGKFWVDLYICSGRKAAVDSLPQGAASGWGEWNIGMPFEELSEELQAVIPKGAASKAKTSKQKMSEWIAAAKEASALIK